MECEDERIIINLSFSSCSDEEVNFSYEDDESQTSPTASPKPHRVDQHSTTFKFVGSETDFLRPFKEAQQLLLSPSAIVGRDDEKKAIIQHLLPLVRHQVGGSLYISGIISILQEFILFDINLRF
jgi:hypothetical protein